MIHCTEQTDTSIRTLNVLDSVCLFVLFKNWQPRSYLKILRWCLVALAAADDDDNTSMRVTWPTACGAYSARRLEDVQYWCLWTNDNTHTTQLKWILETRSDPVKLIRYHFGQPWPSDLLTNRTRTWTSSGSCAYKHASTTTFGKQQSTRKMNSQNRMRNFRFVVTSCSLEPFTAASWWLNKTHSELMLPEPTLMKLRIEQQIHSPLDLVE